MCDPASWTRFPNGDHVIALGPLRGDATSSPIIDLVRIVQPEGDTVLLISAVPTIPRPPPQPDDEG